MTVRFPIVDSRRAEQLYRELLSIASVALPDWQPAEDGGEFGDALLQITARMAEHLTLRADKTPLRDMTAFYRLLDIPADWARPAQVPLVFLLSDNRNTEVFAPAGVQVAAATDEGDVVFETQNALKLTPARLAFLAFADAGLDSIEVPPPGFLDLAPKLTQEPDYRVITLAQLGSKVLQIEPTEGWEAGDFARIDGTVYRVEDNKDGLIILLDVLEANVAANTPVQRVNQFDAQRMRDLQEHSVYIGHKNLLQLEKPATLRLAFNPSDVAGRVVGEGYRWQLYGIRQGQELPAWHDLLVSIDDSDVVLQKTWEGSVEELDIHGEKSRWLRLMSENPIASETVEGTRTQSITLCLATLRDEDLPPQEPDPCAPAGNLDNDLAQGGGLLSNSGDTISQAFYNATPLPLTSRFFPFGSVPQRFDTFALAAPEAFSKVGATVTLSVTLTDASFVALGAVRRTQTTARDQRLYGIGRSGKLSVLTLTENRVDWDVLDSPMLEDFSGTVPENVRDNNDVLLSDHLFDAIEVRLSILDLILLRDRSEGYWLRRVPLNLSVNLGDRDWSFVSSPDGVRLIDARILGQSALTRRIVMIAVGNDGRFYQRGLSLQGAFVRLDGHWLPLNPIASAPNLNDLSSTSAAHIVVVRQPDQEPVPSPHAAFLSKSVLIVDALGDLWFAIWSETNLQLGWQRLSLSFTLNRQIVPEAVFVDEHVIVIFAVRTDGEPVAIHFDTRDAQTQSFVAANPPRLDNDTVIRLHDDSANVQAGFVYTDDDNEVVIDFWTSTGVKQRLRVPPNFRPLAPASAVLTHNNTSQPLLVAGGPEESINQFLLPHTTDYQLFYGLTSSTPDPGAGIDFIEPAAPEVFVPLNDIINPVIEDSSTPRYVYQVAPMPDLRAPRDWKLFHRLQSFVGTRVLSATDRLVIDAGDSVTQDATPLHIAGERYQVNGAPQSLRVARVDADLPASAPEYRVLLAWQHGQSLPAVINLDINDTFTAAGHELNIGGVHFSVKSVNSGAAQLAFALPDFLSIAYRLQPADPPFVGGRTAANVLALDSHDLTTAAGTELLIAGHNFKVESVAVNAATLFLCLPRGASFSYGVLNHAGTTYTATRDGPNLATKDAADTVSAKDSVWIVGNLRFTVLQLTGNSAELSAGMPPLASEPKRYDNRSLPNFTGYRRSTRLLELPSGDSYTEAGGELSVTVGGTVLGVLSVDPLQTVALVDSSGASKHLPAGGANAIQYDVLGAVSPQPDAFGAVNRWLYRLDWSVDFDRELERLRFVPAGDLSGEITQTVTASEVTADNAFNWVLASSAVAVSEQNGSVALLTADTERWESETLRNFENPELSWEYFDGNTWRNLERGFDDRTAFFSKSGDIQFEVPEDLSPTEISGKDDFWIRARLIGGDYGRPIYRVNTSTQGAESTQEITVDNSRLNPPEILHIEAAFSLEKKVPPQQLLIKNNLDFRRQTQANLEAGAGFELFEGVQKINRQRGSRALYLGFNKAFHVSPLSLYIDAEDQDDDMAGELSFDVLGADDRWVHLSAQDETQGMNRSGFIQVSVNVEPRRARRFGQEGFWLRARPRFASSHWAPRLRGIFINAGRAHQARTFRQEILGASLGEPGLSLNVANKPVLPDSLELRVRETLSDEEKEALNTGRQAQSSPTVMQYPERSLVGDWVRWTRVDSFIGRHGEERIFKLDTLTGTVTFGNDRQGRIPPAGADNIRAILYQTGGGLAGNLPAYRIVDLKTSVEAVDEVANPIAAAGGTAVPGLRNQLRGAPAMLRRSQQALAPVDIEALVVASSPDLLRARCFYPEAAEEPIRVVIALRNGERFPAASLAVRSQLAEHIRREAWGGLRERDVEVVNPDYLAVELTLRLIPKDSGASAALEQAASELLQQFLHPLEGGPPNAEKVPGWDFGRTLYPSDIYRALAALPGLDHVACIDGLRAKSGDLGALGPTGLIGAAATDIHVSIALSNEGGMAV